MKEISASIAFSKFVIILYSINLFYAIVGGMSFLKMEYIHRNEIVFMHFLLVGSDYIVCSSCKGKTIHYALYFHVNVTFGEYIILMTSSCLIIKAY